MYDLKLGPSLDVVHAGLNLLAYMIALMPEGDVNIVVVFTVISLARYVCV